MSTFITIPQLPDSNDLDRNDYIILYNAESSPDVLTYKGRVGDVLDLVGGIHSVNGKTGATITITPDDLNDAITSNKFVTASDKTKIAIIRTDQGSGTFLAGDGIYRTVGGSFGNNNYTVNTIADRDSLSGLNNGDRVLVIDASSDPIVTRGAALYFWNSGTGQFVLVADSIELNFTISGLTSQFHAYTATTNSTLSTIQTNYVTGATTLGGVGLFSNKTSHRLNFKGLVAGNGITLTPSSTGVTINGATVGNYVSATTFNYYTGTTAPALYALKSKFNTYTGTTAPSQFQSHSSIVTLTGTTLPATYASKSNFNSFTGTTSSRLSIIESNYVTGATNLGSGNGLFTSISNHKLQLKSLVGGTGITIVPTSTGLTFNGATVGNYVSATTFNFFTGTTAPATYLRISNFNTYSGATNTAINNRLLITNFNTYSGATNTAINNRLLISSFNPYSGATNTRITNLENVYTVTALFNYYNFI